MSEPWGTPERPAVCECTHQGHAGRPCRRPPGFPDGVLTTPALCMLCRDQHATDPGQTLLRTPDGMLAPGPVA